MPLSSCIRRDVVVLHERHQRVTRDAAEPAARHAEPLEPAAVEAADDRLLRDLADLGRFAGGEYRLHAASLHPRETSRGRQSVPRRGTHASRARHAKIRSNPRGRVSRATYGSLEPKRAVRVTGHSARLVEVTESLSVLLVAQLSYLTIDAGSNQLERPHIAPELRLRAGIAVLCIGC